MKNKNIIVLGAGMVGSAMALDLAKDHKVTVADLSETALQKLKLKDPSISIQTLNVSDKKKLSEILSPFDLVVCAVPGFLGFETLKTIIECGKNTVDISFFPENSLDLCELAKSKNVIAIVDCGVAPGMDNILLGYHNARMKVTDFECLVGGLPKVKKWPFNYKAPFSPIDVIEEYTRPARYVENGNVIVKPAMSDIEHLEFEKVGTLESFNSDGLRSLIFTMPHIRNMKEKTLRYPGHIEKVLALRDSGFFSKEPVLMNGKEIIPIEFTSKVLFKEWKLGEKEEELTVMRVSIEGEENGVKKKVVYNLYDEYSTKTETSSMARTTGYTATAAVGLILNGLFTDKGVFPPELISKEEKCFQHILDHLKKRDIYYKKTEV